MDLMAIILVAVFIGGLLWLLRNRNAPLSKRPNTEAIKKADPSAPSPYQSVTVRYSQEHCAAVAAIGNKIFLSNEAPQLPLSGCDVDNCKCRYVHHEDRRRENRRSLLQSIQNSFAQSKGWKSRENRDRRKS